MMLAKGCLLLRKKWKLEQAKMTQCVYLHKAALQVVKDTKKYIQDKRFVFNVVHWLLSFLQLDAWNFIFCKAALYQTFFCWNVWQFDSDSKGLQWSRTLHQSAWDPNEMSYPKCTLCPWYRFFPHPSWDTWKVWPTNNVHRESRPFPRMVNSLFGERHLESGTFLTPGNKSPDMECLGLLALANGTN